MCKVNVCIAGKEHLLMTRETGAAGALASACSQAQRSYTPTKAQPCLPRMTKQHHRALDACTSNCRAAAHLQHRLRPLQIKAGACGMGKVAGPAAAEAAIRLMLHAVRFATYTTASRSWPSPGKVILHK